MPLLPGFHISEIDTVWVILASVLSIIGLAQFVYGRKRKNLIHQISGVIFMAYPMFVTNVPVMVGIAVGLGGFVWWLSH